MNHFRLYHVWLGVLFGLNAITDSLWTTLFLLFWAPLALDVIWWLIRYYDIRVRNHNNYGEPNAWCARTDWDNYGGFPLLCGCYVWWWIFAAICTLFGLLAIFG